MIPFEARARTYLNSLPDDHPEKPLVKAHVDLIEAQNEALRAASQANQVVVYREEESKHADLVTTLNHVGGALDDDIPIKELRSSIAWKDERYSPQIKSWVQTYKSLPKGQKNTVTSTMRVLTWNSDIHTIGQLRSATFDQLPLKEGKTVSRKTLDFAQAVFARPLTPAQA